MRVRCDFDALYRFGRRVRRLPGAVDDTLCRELCEFLAQLLLEAVREKTPVVTGTLRDGWEKSPAAGGGGVWQAVVMNGVAYAGFVELGHSQTPGRFVPALGRRLKKAWVPGRFMLRLSEAEIRDAAPALLAAKIQKRLEEYLNGG